MRGLLADPEQRQALDRIADQQLRLGRGKAQPFAALDDGMGGQDMVLGADVETELPGNPVRPFARACADVAEPGVPAAEAFPDPGDGVLGERLAALDAADGIEALGAADRLHLGVKAVILRLQIRAGVKTRIVPWAVPGSPAPASAPSPNAQPASTLPMKSEYSFPLPAADRRMVSTRIISDQVSGLSLRGLGFGGPDVIGSAKTL